jgi:hypothetical protein
MIRERRWSGSTDRYARFREVERLDLESQYWQITRLFLADFQSVMIGQLYQGFLTTFAAPRMSRILAGTGEIGERTAKRAIDTALLTRAVFLDGVENGEGLRAARRVNAMHRRYPIAQEDLTAVGVDAALTQIRLATEYGWRPVLTKEMEAVRRCFERITMAYGGRLEFPGSIEAMEGFWARYKHEQFAFEPQNRELATAITTWFLGLVPRPLRPALRLALIGTADPDVLEATGFRVPTAVEARIARVIVRRGIGWRDPVPDGGPEALDVLAKMVYPQGHAIEDLGSFTNRSVGHDERT